MSRIATALRATTLLAALASLPATTLAANLFEVKKDDALELADADMLLEQLRGILWGSKDVAGPIEKDFRGMTFGDDVNAVVLLEPANRKLEAAMTAARTRTDPAGVRQALDEVRDRIINQRERWTIVIGYWGMQAAVEHHATLLAPVLADRAAAEPAKSALDAARKQIFDFRERALTGPDIGFIEGTIDQIPPMNQLLGRLNQQRMAWMDRHPSAGTVDVLKHEAACGPAVPPDPKKRDPSLGPVGEGPEKFYSAEAQHLNIEGNVVVRAYVAANGCLERVAIQQSSGSPDLDASALRYADTMSFVPGYDGKQAAAGSFPFRVRFQLFD